MKISVDPDICEGHGQCEQVAPDLFQLPDDIDVVEVLKETIEDPEEIKLAIAAEATCPRAAIKLTE